MAIGEFSIAFSNILQGIYDIKIISDCGPHWKGEPCLSNEKHLFLIQDKGDCPTKLIFLIV